MPVQKDFIQNNGFITYRDNGIKKHFSFPLNSPFQKEGIELLPEITTGIFEEIKLTLKTDREIILEKLYLEDSIEITPDSRIFVNGYQTWSESREYRPDERLPGLSRAMKPLYSKFHLHRFGDYYFYRYSGIKGRFHSYSHTYTRKSGQNLSFYGSLAENTGFTIFQYSVKNNKIQIIKDCGGLKVNGEFTALHFIKTAGNEREVFNYYFEALKLKKPHTAPASGWTSWYNYYTNITEEIILENLKAFTDRKIPIDIFQIDDGYQQAVGDWLTVNKKFPGGMKKIADEIKKAGYRAGIWIAPFICVRDSELFHSHPEWVSSDNNGKPVLAGHNWNSDFFSLDIYHPGVRDYLNKVFDLVLNDWGFDLLKLDFLYAACIPFRPNKTRGQVMSEGAAFLRELAGDKIILGCGIPLASAYGIFDYCRVSSDVSTVWEYKDASSIHYRERVSTINALQSTISRRQLDGFPFLNDPDVSILRSQNTSMTIDQKYTLFLLNLLFGSLYFISDNLNEYTDEELDLYLTQFPIKKARNIKVETLDSIYRWKHKSSIEIFLRGGLPYQTVYRISFDIENRNYHVLSNLGNKTVRVDLNEGFYFDNRYHSFITGGRKILIPPYETVCLLVLKNEDYEIAGSTGHIFPGCEVSEYYRDLDNITFKVSSQLNKKIKIFIQIPQQYKGAAVNGQYYQAVQIDGHSIVEVETQ